MSMVSSFPRRVGASLVLATVLTAFAGLPGCAVGSDDLHKWEGTEHGPDKLYAVLTHDKYSDELRKEAAMGLIRMPARGGARIGIRILTEKHKSADGDEREGAMVGLSDARRQAILALMMPELIKQLETAPPVHDAKDKAAPDGTVPYKDAVYALVFHEPPLVTNADQKKKLQDALIKWAQNGFEDRIDNSTQQFGLEQMMRSLGKDSVRPLPALINDQAYRLDRVVNLINEIGDDETKKKASDALVATAKTLESAEWWAATTKRVDDQNKSDPKSASAKATPEQVKVQVSKVQDKKFNDDLFPAMKRIGGKSVIDYLFAYAANIKKPEERRKLALAALEGRPDKKNPQDLERLFAIAKDDDTTDGIRDLAFNRIGELPKEQIIPKLYQLMEPKKWKVRWVAASLILKSIKTSELQEFLNKLPASPKTKMGMTEGLSYGSLIAKMEPGPGEPKPRDVILPALNSKNFGAKMTAIGFFYDGKKADAALVTPLEADKEAVPKCEKEDDCQWQCGVTKPGAAEAEVKEVTTVGEVVKMCIVPTMTK